MVRLAGTLSRIERTRVMVIGDVVLDTYTLGKAQRISPEAPVPVIQVHHEEYRPGMAGNVALNLVSLGIKTVLVGRVGDDRSGELLRRVLEDEGVDVRGLCVQKGLQTPVKNRIIADHQQIVRVDREDISPLEDDTKALLLASLPELLQDIKAIALSDYAKGLFSPALLSAIIALARERRIPVIADPKGRDFSRYSGVTVIKPNLGEAIAAAGLSPGAPLERVAEQIFQTTDAEMLMITRSEAGLSLFFPDRSREDYPVRAQEIRDVTGAGDTVLAMLACALASGLSYQEAAQLCNVAASVAISRFGCARVSLADLAHCLLANDPTNKIFDQQHLFALQEVLADKSVIVLGIHSKDGLSAQLFSIIQRLAEKDNSALLIYLRDAEPDERFLQLLLSLREVSFIIRPGDSLRHFCAAIQPAEVYIADGGEVRSLEHGLALLHV